MSFISKLPKDCGEEFRHMARHLSRVSSDWCVGEPTKKGKIIEEYVGYYDEIDWKLGQFYLVKCIFKTMSKQYIEDDNVNFVRYLEDNLSFDIICDLFRITKDAMNNNPCCFRHCIWDKEQTYWPTSLEDEDTSSVSTINSDSEEYWESYDIYENELEEYKKPLDIYREL